jgi:site-specific DNA-cytosine methylase
MKNTVVIFNAGIGALTLGFQNAGYEILKAYEPDRKVIEIYPGKYKSKCNCMQPFFHRSCHSSGQ